MRKLGLGWFPNLHQPYELYIIIFYVRTHILLQSIFEGYTRTINYIKINTLGILLFIALFANCRSATILLIY